MHELFVAVADLDLTRSVEIDRHYLLAKDSGIHLEMLLSAYVKNDVENCILRVCTELIGSKVTLQQDDAVYSYF